MKKIFRMWSSLFCEMIGMENDKSFLVMPTKLSFMLLVCGVIGLLRNTWHIAFCRTFFYSFDSDIIATMFFWPMHLFLFPALLLYFGLRLLRYNNVNAGAILALIFSLQIFHLLIPLLDLLGDKLGIPYWYVLGREAVFNERYINILFMTPGIIIAWLLSIYMVVTVMRKYYAVGWLEVIFGLSLILFFIILPDYFLWPNLNVLFNYIFGVWKVGSLSLRSSSPFYLICWGYATYMMITALLGYCYFTFIKARRRFV